jgi:spore germination protein GerM
MLLSSCGLPGDGSVRTVDDDTVPPGLLDSADPSSATDGATEAPGPVPVVFWLVDEDRLTPATTDASCTQSAEVVVTRLLGALAAGPTEEERAVGRSTAIPPESAPALVDMAAGTVRVEVDPEASISADRLPAAVGQIVLTVTSAPGVRSVVLVSDGAPVQLPLPGGALTDGPVTADDYAPLVADRYQQPREVGCPG